ncbi:MAG: Response regulator ArlR [candidate division WS6 bacterium OLB20]|uniref:Response regulator ArlR n=1 Tax=candidate division WS6 bacterium OLB20 TaxID=1617426 RepID=A0A136LWH0_9BACT|nr:MAG: Response regulator ArlR [candidate division WS6 bacterium OLB20]
MYSLLIVEDDARLSACISEYLHGYQVFTESTVKGGIRVARNRQVDAVLLDLQLGTENGLSLLKHLRSDLIETPVLILTSDETTDTVCTAMQLGADGYMTKPFSMRELKARIDALLNRPPLTRKDIIAVHDLVLDCNNCQVRRGRQTVNLRKREFEILSYLARHQGTIVTRQQLISNVWDSYSEPYAGTIDVHISNIRKQLRSTFGTDMITTAHGLGYQVHSRKV